MSAPCESQKEASHHRHLLMLCWVSQALLLPFPQLFHILSLGPHSACINHRSQWVPPKHTPASFYLQPSAVFQSLPSRSYSLPFTPIPTPTPPSHPSHSPVPWKPNLTRQKTKIFLQFNSWIGRRRLRVNSMYLLSFAQVPSRTANLIFMIHGKGNQSEAVQQREGL